MAVIMIDKQQLQMLGEDIAQAETGKFLGGEVTASASFSKIRGWALDRNLINGSDRFRQLCKLSEEMGELAGGIAKGNEQMVYDSIGDMVVVLTILASQSGVTIEDCIDLAWDEIKDRKGKMVDGVFVKESDL